jgi:hypothetical protein
MITFNFIAIVYTQHKITITYFHGVHMPIIIEAILVSAAMLLIFALAFLAIFLLAITMSPIERSLSKMIWDATTPKRLSTPTKGSFRDFSKRH